MTPQLTQTPTLRIPGYRHIKDTQLMVWLEGSGNYTLIYLKDTRHPLMVAQTLKYFKHHLPGFIRVSRSSLVNPTYIRKIVEVDVKMMHLELMGGTLIVVPRRRIPSILDRLEATPDLMLLPGPTT